MIDKGKHEIKKKKIEKLNLVDDGTKFRKKINKKPLANKDYKFFKKSVLKNNIEIRFDELINNGFPKELNQFNLIKKRTYCNKIDLIIDINNRIFNEYPLNSELLFSYLSLKWRIDKKDFKDKYVICKKDGKKIIITNEEGKKVYKKKLKETAEKQFLNDLYNGIFNETFVEFIESFVERNYKLDIDSKNKEKNKKYNPVLQFSDAHCKILQCVSIGMKIIIPLLLHYSFMYNERKMNDFLQRSFDYLFKIFSHDVDIQTKLWESVYSRVIVTKNSDKSYWEYVAIEGASINKITSSLYQKLIVDIVPKYELDQNLINLNHVFINNNLDYTFRSNIEINYKVLNYADTEDDVSDWEKISINTAKIDEGEIIINECNIKNTIKSILKKENIKISEEEFNYYQKGFSINKLQQSLLFNFFSKYFGSTNTLFFCNQREYIILLLIMKKILLKNSFTLIPYISTGKVKNINEKSTLNKKSLIRVTSSVDYKELILNKYHFTENNLKNKSGLIIRLITNILNNKFLLKDYEHQDLEGEEIKIDNIDILAEEIMRFINYI